MKPYYNRNGITIYCGDCLEVMPLLGEFDLVLTDPPYGVLSESWDDMTPQELARFTMRWASIAAEKSENLISFFGEQTRKIIVPILEMLYPEVRQLVWNKQGGEFADNKMFFAYESIWYCHQGERDTWEVAEPKNLDVAQAIRTARERAGLSRGAVDMVVRGKKTGLCYRWEEAACLPTPEQIEMLKPVIPLNGDFDKILNIAYALKNEVVSKNMDASKLVAKKNAAKSTDVFTIPQPSKKVHKAQKPVDLLRRLILAAPGTPQTILDPFLGSGTTLKAAQDLGRQAVGVEQNEEYCKLAVESLKQQSLFTPPSNNQNQAELLQQGLWE